MLTFHKRNMSPVWILALAVVSLLVSVVSSEKGETWHWKCSPAEGIAGQKTVVNCPITDNDDKVIIAKVTLRNDQGVTVFKQDIGQPATGDPRISLESSERPSLIIRDTKIYDQGKYHYRLETDSSLPKTFNFTITVRAKYNNPVTSSVPANISDGKPAHLYCNATGGYPAGTIHWFDQTGTNWTVNAELRKIDTESGSVNLSSKLSFRSIDTSYAPFRCIVLNSRGDQEGEGTVGRPPAVYGSKKDDISQATNIVAPAVVIGSLIVGLLVVLLFRRRKQANNRTELQTRGEEEKDHLQQV